MATGRYGWPDGVVGGFRLLSPFCPSNAYVPMRVFPSLKPASLKPASLKPASLKLVLVLLAAFAAGCHHGEKKSDEAETLPVDQMYKVAHDSLEEGNLTKA